MATWQFDYHLIPASSIDRHYRWMPVALGEEEYDTVPWWAGFHNFSDFEDDLSKVLPAAPSWHPRMRSWGVEDGDRFDVTRDGTAIREVFGRIDVRSLSLPFLNRVLELARKHELLIVTEDRHVLRPSMKELLGAIHRSSSFAFVSDPVEFLSRLAKAD
jgi:hypothetical protein